MIKATEDLAKVLRSARTSKRLSQRELSERAGLPQAHISKIENGAVDLRVSSLVALARVLDLELTLVPRKAVPAVQSIVRSGELAIDRASSQEALEELRRLRKSIETLPPSARLEGGLAQLKRRLQEVERFPLAAQHVPTLKRANQALRALKAQKANSAKRQTDLRTALSAVEVLRNELLHAPATTSRTEPARPAYSLEDEDDSDA